MVVVDTESPVLCNICVDALLDVPKTVDMVCQLDDYYVGYVAHKADFITLLSSVCECELELSTMIDTCFIDGCKLNIIVNPSKPCLSIVC